MQLIKSLHQTSNWLIYFFLYSFIFLIGTETFIISPMLPTIASSLKVSITDASYIVVAYVLTYAILGPFIGIASDFKRKTSFILIGCLIFAVGNYLASIAISLSAIIFARVIIGAGAATAGPAIWSFIADTAPKNMQGRLLGMGMAAFSFGQIVGVPIGTLLSAQFNYGMTFLCISIFSSVLFLLLFVLFFQSPQRSSRTQEGLSMHVKNFKFLNFTEISVFAITFFFNAVNLGSYTYVGTLFKQRYSLNTEQLGLIVICVGVASLIGSLFAGRLIDHWREANKKEEILIAIYSALLGISIAGMIYFHILLLDLALLSIWFMLSGAFVTSQQALLISLNPGKRGTLISLNNSVMYIGTAIGVSIIGLLLKNDWNMIWFTLSFCGVASICAFFLFKKNGTPHLSSQAKRGISTYQENRGKIYAVSSSLRQSKDIPWIIRLLPKSEYNNFADICCGSGNFIKEIINTKRINYVLGIDKSSSMLKQAKKTFSEIKSSYPYHKDLICTDLTINTPQLHKKFDLITMMSALHWLYPNEQKIMNWIHTQMNSQGDFIFTSYHPHENYNQVGGTDLIVLEAIKRLGINQNKLNNFILMSTRTRAINDIHQLISPWFLIKQIETKEATMYINNIKERSVLVFQ